MALWSAKGTWVSHSLVVAAIEAGPAAVAVLHAQHPGAGRARIAACCVAVAAPARACCAAPSAPCRCRRRRDRTRCGARSTSRPAAPGCARPVARARGSACSAARTPPAPARDRRRRRPACASAWPASTVSQTGDRQGCTRRAPSARQQQTVELAPAPREQRMVLGVAQHLSASTLLAIAGRIAASPSELDQPLDHPGARALRAARRRSGPAPGSRSTAFSSAVDAARRALPVQARGPCAGRRSTSGRTARRRRTPRGQRHAPACCAHRIDSGTKIVRDQLDMS